jgi:hypothetical protein
MRNIDIGRRRVFEAMVFHVGDAADDLDPVHTENPILAMKSPFSDDAAPISSSN